MQSIVFPRKGNDFWPLPSDYWTLSDHGKKLARVNAAGLGGRPDLEAAGWHFFRETYLAPRGPAWYRTGYSPSPPSHYQWIKDWYAAELLVHAAPRGTCKTTVNLEEVLRKAVTKPYWNVPCSWPPSSSVGIVWVA